jgi:hypothetical protein
MYRALVVLALVACSKNNSEPPPAPTRIPIVPDTVTAQLGAVGFVIAVDLHRLDLGKVAALIPDQLGCTRELLAAADMGVIAAGEHWEGFVTGLPEQPTRACIAKLAPAFGATTHDMTDGFRIDIPDNPVLLAWHGNTVTITQVGQTPRGGDPPGVILDLATSVPRKAQGWIVSSGFPKYKIKSSVMWLETSPSTWTFTITAESTEAGAAKPWVASVIDGFKEGAGAKGVKIDDAWFTLTSSSPTSAKLVAAIPIEAFTKAAR